MALSERAKIFQRATRVAGKIVDRIRRILRSNDYKLTKKTAKNQLTIADEVNMQPGICAKTTVKN